MAFIILHMAYLILKFHATYLLWPFSQLDVSEQEICSSISMHFVGITR